MKITEFIKTAGAVALQAQNGDPEEMKRYIAGILNDQDEEVEDLGVEVEDDLVRLSGRARNASALEKAILIAGNITGISRVSSDGLELLGEKLREAMGRFYTIKPGDTLSEVAKELLGDPGRYMEIVEANKGIIVDPDRIYPGQTIRIP